MDPDTKDMLYGFGGALIGIFLFALIGLTGIKICSWYGHQLGLW